MGAHRGLAIGAGALMLVGASAFGQITRAGAVGTINPVPTAGARSVFRGGSVSCGFGGYRPSVRCSTSYAGGGIVVDGCVTVGGGSWCAGCGCGYLPYGYRSSYVGWPVWEMDRRVGGTIVVPTAPAAPAPPVDEGLEALREGRYSAARVIYVGRWQDRVASEASGEAEGVDRSDLRMAGLAAAAGRRFEEAERLLLDAYAADPSLAGRPLSGARLLGGEREMRRVVTGAVAHAHRTGEASSWRMVSWLMQAEGRFDMARKMATRAEEVRRTSEARAGAVAVASSGVER